MNDRRVHAEGEHIEAVRYDKAGKWYVESKRPMPWNYEQVDAFLAFFVDEIREMTKAVQAENRGNLPWSVHLVIEGVPLLCDELEATRAKLAKKEAECEQHHKLTVTWPDGPAEAAELRNAYWTAIKGRMERAEALAARYRKALAQHQHTDECLSYAAMTGKPFCIVQCRDAWRAFLASVDVEGTE